MTTGTVDAVKTTALPQFENPRFKSSSSIIATPASSEVDIKNCLNAIIQGRPCENVKPEDSASQYNAGLTMVAATAGSGPLTALTLLALSLRNRLWGSAIKTPKLIEAGYEGFFSYLESEDIMAEASVLHPNICGGGKGIVYFDTLDYAKSFFTANFRGPTIIDNGDFGVVEIWRSPDPRTRIQLTIYPKPVQIVPPGYNGDIHDLPVQEPGAELIISQLIEGSAPLLIHALARLQEGGSSVKAELKLTYRFDDTGATRSVELQRIYSRVSTAANGISTTTFLRSEPVFSFNSPTLPSWMGPRNAISGASHLRLVTEPAADLVGGKSRTGAIDVTLTASDAKNGASIDLTDAARRDQLERTVEKAGEAVGAVDRVIRLSDFRTRRP